MSMKNRPNLSDFQNIKLPIFQLFNSIFQRFNLSVLIKNNIVLVIEIFNIIIIKKPHKYQVYYRDDSNNYS